MGYGISVSIFVFIPLHAFQTDACLSGVTCFSSGGSNAVSDHTISQGICYVTYCVLVFHGNGTYVPVYLERGKRWMSQHNVSLHKPPRGMDYTPYDLFCSDISAERQKDAPLWCGMLMLNVVK